MSQEELENIKQELKKYRDLLGGELRIDLIEDASNIFDLSNIIEIHHDLIDDIASDAHTSLTKMSKRLGIF